jgi:glycosyltransferase involved in cell wall biosynthesis
MKILFPLHGVGVGVGSEDYMVDVARRLAERGHALTLVMPGAAAAPSWAAEVIRTPAIPPPGTLTWRVQYLVALTRQVAGALRTRSAAADVVVTGVLPALFAVRLAQPRLPRVYLPLSPLSWFELRSYGQLTPDLRLAARAYDSLQRWAWRHSDVVVSYLPALTALRAKRLGSPRHRLIESPPGVDIDRYKPEPKDPRLLDEFGIAHSAPLVVAFNRLIQSKDLAFLFRAFTQSDVPANAQLLVIGRGPEESALRALAASLGIGARVHFAGFREHPEDYVRLAHVYAFPSRLESFGLTLVQALASGVPAVARRSRFPDVLTMSENLIEHGTSGIIVDDESGMAAAIGALLRDAVRREAMGQAAASAIRSRLSWDAHIDAIDEALASIASSRRR